MARSRSGTRGRRGPRKPPRRDGAFNASRSRSPTRASVARSRCPATITVKELADLLGGQPGGRHPRAHQERHLRHHQPAHRPRHGVARRRRARLRGRRGRRPPAERRRGRGRGARAEATKEVLFEEDDPACSCRAPPIVTVMGHVDHGKTSLLDAIRTTERRGRRARRHHPAHRRQRGRQGRPAASSSSTRPGHEAFTAMRARGARVTDIAVLVVAADDGVMPQTLEAIRPRQGGQGADRHRPQQDRQARRQPGPGQDRAVRGTASSSRSTAATCRSCRSRAKTAPGLDELIEMILLVADLQELKANPKRSGRSARSSRRSSTRAAARSPPSLVQTGTLKVGDIIVVGETYGRVRALENDQGERVTKAGPSIAVVVLGLADVPAAGDILRVVADEKTARTMVEERKAGAARAGDGSGRATLEDLYRQIQAGQAKELRIILKADVSGLAGRHPPRPGAAPDRRGPDQRPARGRRRHHRQRHHAGVGVERDRRRLQHQDRPRPPVAPPRPRASTSASTTSSTS